MGGGIISDCYIAISELGYYFIFVLDSGVVMFAMYVNEKDVND